MVDLIKNHKIKVTGKDKNIHYMYYLQQFGKIYGYLNSVQVFLGNFLKRMTLYNSSNKSLNYG